MKKIILLTLLVIIGALTIGQTVYADSAVLYVLPASANSLVGKTFSISVQINPAGNKVCVVKGAINFSGLSCQSIALASGVMAQTTPTCSNPNFTIGIPRCTSTVQNLISLSVKGSQAGQASAAFSGVKVIGVGSNVAYNLQSGSYNITSVQTTAPTTQTTTPNTTQQTSTQPAAPENNIPVSAGVAALPSSGIFNTTFLTIIIIIALILAGWWIGAKFFFKKKK